VHEPLTIDGKAAARFAAKLEEAAEYILNPIRGV
jgi:hypothetical protein